MGMKRTGRKRDPEATLKALGWDDAERVDMAGKLAGLDMTPETRALLFGDGSKPSLGILPTPGKKGAKRVANYVQRFLSTTGKIQYAAKTK